MFIDSHQHFWRFNPVRDAWITNEMSILKRDFLPCDLIPQLKANGVDGCLAVQADQSEDETRFLLELADAHPEIKGVVGWVDLCAAGVGGRLKYFSQFAKLRGFRHIVQSEPDDWFLLRKDFVRGIEALSTHGFTYDILIYPRQLPAAIELVAMFPKHRFVVDHIAKPPIRTGELKPWADLILQLASYQHVYCKLSGMVTEADCQHWQAANFKPYLDVVFQAFGPDRLMFGSDWPVCMLAGSYTQVRDLVFRYTSALAPEERARIFGLNAIEFYGLKTDNHGLESAR